MTEEKPAILGPNGKQARPVNHCIFWKCGRAIKIPRQFCEDHWQDVPGHLRHAVQEEAAWMNARKLAADRHWLGLLNVAVNRAIACRALRLPEFAAELELAMREAEEKNAEASSKLLLPHKAGELVVAPGGPTT